MQELFGDDFFLKKKIQRNKNQNSPKDIPKPQEGGEP